MLKKSKNLIDVKVRDVKVNGEVRIVLIYGLIDFGERQVMWRMVSEMGMNIGIPWMCVGYFNDILYNYEKEIERIRAERNIRGFRQMIDECKLIDLKP